MDAVTGMFDTGTVDTAKSCGTFLGTGTIAQTADTFGAIFGRLDIIDIAITVVIAAITDFCLWGRSVALFPIAIDTDLLTGSTDGAAGATEAIIDFAIAVVVFSVADFGFGFGAGAVDPFAFVTGFRA